MSDARAESGPASDERRRTATRADILEGVAQACPVPLRGVARDIFESALTEISDALLRGESVKLRSFGLFMVRAKRERVGRNPRTGVEVPIRARRVLIFRPSPVLVDLMNRSEPLAAITIRLRSADGHAAAPR